MRHKSFSLSQHVESLIRDGARAMLPPSVKQWLKMLSRPAYRRTTLELRRLRAIPSFTATYTNLLGKAFKVVDVPSFLPQYHNLIAQESMRFHTAHASPLIIDAGANVGVSVVYFKRLYPSARIIAFEADPAIFSVLEENCASFSLTDVQLVPMAVWTQATTVNFSQQGGDSGHIRREGDNFPVTAVPACRLKDYLLGQKVALLKMDIEGAETEVLRDCQEELTGVDHLFVEHHSVRGRPQDLHVLIGVLQAAGFRLNLCQSEPLLHPFTDRSGYWDFDILTNVYAFRDR